MVLNADKGQGEKQKMDNEKWTIVIKAQNGWFDINLKELWQYKDLIFLFVKRNYSTRYKQTILGPAWLFINPMLSTIMYSIVFNQIAHLSTDGAPPLAFYMAGNILWGCFATCINQTANTFLENANIMGKVYFPRLVMPIATMITAIIDFCIQLILFLGTLIICIISGAELCINLWILAVPMVIVELAIFGLGCGIIVSSLTTKYRDLKVLVSFGVQLWMYATPVVYSITLIPEKFRNLYLLNPVAPCVLIFKHAFLGIGEIPYIAWIISWMTTIAILLIGILIFNRVEKTFMDTV